MTIDIPLDPGYYIPGRIPKDVNDKDQRYTVYIIHTFNSCQENDDCKLDESTLNKL